MIQDETLKHKYYTALINKDSSFDGVFFAGIKTTGIFCHPTCTARKPKYENCEFYEHANEALLAGYRPCKRCEPLNYPHEIPNEIRRLVEAVETNPEKRWKDRDFKAYGIHSATARRLFKKHYAMTFVQYARSRRLGIAFKAIRENESKSIIDTQLEIGYQSHSGFHDAFSKIMGQPISKKDDVNLLMASWLDTPIGPMLAIADDQYLYLLEFVDRRGLELEIERLRQRLNAQIIPGYTKIHQQLELQLVHYYNGSILTFDLPLYLLGSPFQTKVWKALQTIPVAETVSYKQLAIKIEQPQAVRAVGRANGMNQLAIIIPCHRVIQSDGSLGGYAGGLERKAWLLAHEAKYRK